MKVCPKCQSTYSDETLNFCLTDGAPLAAVEASAENLSRPYSWHSTETLQDPNFKIHSSAAHTTSPNSSSPTLPDMKTSAVIPEREDKSFFRRLVPLAAAVLALGVIGGIVWHVIRVTNQSSNNENSKISSATTQTPEQKKTAASLTADEANQVKKEIADFLETWRATNEKGDIEEHMKCYADTLATYYKENGINKNHVRADRLRAYDAYDSIGVQIDNLKISLESADAATAVFDKTWTFKNSAWAPSRPTIPKTVRFGQ